jgi:hypothetical protein
MNEMNMIMNDLDGKKTRSAKIQYLRKVISQTQREIKSLMKSPNKITVINDPEDGPQPEKNKNLAKQTKTVQRKVSGILSDLLEEDRRKEKDFTRDKTTGETKRKRIKTRSMRGGGGGAMTDLSQRTGATAKGTLFKKKMY